jgi:hypothetical protein
VTTINNIAPAGNIIFMQFAGGLLGKLSSSSHLCLGGQLRPLSPANCINMWALHASVADDTTTKKQQAKTHFDRKLLAQNANYSLWHNLYTKVIFVQTLVSNDF